MALGAGLGVGLGNNVEQKSTAAVPFMMTNDKSLTQSYFKNNPQGYPRSASGTSACRSTM